MKALRSFETSGSSHPTTQRHAPEDLNLIHNALRAPYLAAVSTPHLQNTAPGATSALSQPDRFSVFLSLFRLRLLSSQRLQQIPSEFLQVHHALLIYIISVTGGGSFNNLSGNQFNDVRRTGLGSTGQL